MTYKVFTDGGSRGNPGPGAAAYVVYDGAGNLMAKRGKYLGIVTNNEAEYQAVVEALGAYPKDDLNFFLDSTLVVNQLNGLWKVKEARIRDLVVKVRSLENGRNVSYAYVPREQNKVADALVNETLDSKMF